MHERASTRLEPIDLYYLHTPTMTDSPFEEIIETLAGMRQDGLIRHIGLANVNADQLRTALSITDIAAVSVHYNVAVRLGAPVHQAARDAGIAFPHGTRAPFARHGGPAIPRRDRSDRRKARRHPSADRSRARRELR
jgi:aryl-alcohol dehydrogenase-like predicted oxidoreductase